MALEADVVIWIEGRGELGIVHMDLWKPPFREGFRLRTLRRKGMCFVSGQREFGLSLATRQDFRRSKEIYENGRRDAV